MSTIDRMLGAPVPTPEMEERFDTRTRQHVALFKEFYAKLAEVAWPLFEEERLMHHDDSKFTEPERTPYVWVTWKYHCKDNLKVPFEAPEGMEDRMNAATLYHVTSNNHHPEFYADKDEVAINRDDRDKPPEAIIHAESMPNEAIGEMVCDWCAVAKERGNTPKAWADKNVGKRWFFTPKQTELIYKLIDLLWTS